MNFESKWGLKLHKSSVHHVHTFMDYDETGFGDTKKILTQK